MSFLTVLTSKFSDLGQFEIPVPPLPEQQRIVYLLDEAFAAIAKAKANAEQNLKNAKELFESYLQGVFENGNNDWEVKCLDELGTITSSKRIYKSEYVKDGVPFYRTKEIKELSNGKPITLELFISRDRYEQIKKSFGVPQIGDLLMSAVGTIGEIMVIENEDEFYFKDGNIVWFKDFQRLDTNYLKYALTAFVEKIKSLAIGAAYSALTIEKLNKYEIAFPRTKEEQQTIVRQLDALRAETQKLEAVYQKKIADLEELKKSILQKAFAGELRGGEPAEPKTEKSRRDDKIIENKINHPRTNPEGVK
jgi:type I restriction enzyme, S subunit